LNYHQKGQKKGISFVILAEVLIVDKEVKHVKRKSLKN